MTTPAAVVARLARDGFLRNVLVLMTGTAFAQALTFAMAPVLTRLYDPASFGVFGLFTSLVGIVGVVATGGYHLAIVLADDDGDAVNVLALAAGITGCVSLASLVLVAGAVRTNWLPSLAGGDPTISALVWWLPPAVLAIGLFNGLNYWFTRKRRFAQLSSARLLQTATAVGTQTAAGLLGFGAAGLVVGQVAGQVLSSLSLVGRLWRRDEPLLRRTVRPDRVRRLAGVHRDFPRYSSPQALLNALSQNIPALLLAASFTPATVGFYLLAHRLLALPTSLVRQSVRQVFYERVNSVPQRLRARLLLRTTASLALIGLLPALLVVAFAPALFEIVLGAGWREAGVYARYLTLWLYVAFLNPPSVMMFPVLNAQRAHLGIEVVFLGVRAAALLAGGYLGSAVLAVALFAAAGAVFNLVLIGYAFWRTYGEGVAGSSRGASGNA